MEHITFGMGILAWVRFIDFSMQILQSLKEKLNRWADKHKETNYLYINAEAIKEYWES